MELESSVKTMVGVAQLAKAAHRTAMNMSVNIFEGRFKFFATLRLRGGDRAEFSSL